MKRKMLNMNNPHNDGSRNFSEKLRLSYIYHIF